MNQYKQSLQFTTGYNLKCIDVVAKKIADIYQVYCSFDRTTKKTGWFSKEYEYDIDFTGDKEMVDKTIYAMRTYIANTINAIHKKEQNDLPIWLDGGKPWWLG